MCYSLLYCILYLLYWLLYLSFSFPLIYLTCFFPVSQFLSFCSRHVAHNTEISGVWLIINASVPHQDLWEQSGGMIGEVYFKTLPGDWWGSFETWPVLVSVVPCVPRTPNPGPILLRRTINGWWNKNARFIKINPPPTSPPNKLNNIS